MEELVDYTSEGFTIPIIKDDTKGYASIHAEMYRDDDGLDLTGRYFVYLLHPTMGSTHFELESTTSHVKPWKKVGGAIWVGQDVVKDIIQQIEARRNISH